MKKADAIWNKGPELIDDDGEVRELTAEDFKHFRPFSELPLEEQHVLLEIQRGNVTICPDPVVVELSSDVAAKFAATGKGWESRVNVALREWLEEHKAS